MTRTFQQALPASIAVRAVADPKLHKTPQSHDRFRGFGLSSAVGAARSMVGPRWGVLVLKTWRAAADPPAGSGRRDRSGHLAEALVVLCGGRVTEHRIGLVEALRQNLSGRIRLRARS